MNQNLPYVPTVWGLGASRDTFNSFVKQIKWIRKAKELVVRPEKRFWVRFRKLKTAIFF